MNWNHPDLKEKKRILVTGAAGFVGHHFIEELIINTSWDVVALCRLNTVGDMNKFADQHRVRDAGDRLTFLYHDLQFTLNESLVEKIGKVDYIVHLAANSHVDRSITHPKEFFQDNVMGTVNVLEFARLHAPEARFINFCTDEVFGPAPHGVYWKESDRFYPSNPYSAAKAGAALAGISYYVTYKLPIITTYTMNIFGQRQHPEKLVPKTMLKVLKGDVMPIHSALKTGEYLKNAQGQPFTRNYDDVKYVGERHWLHVRNASNATLYILLHGVVGESYNIVGDTELDNYSMVKLIARYLNKPINVEFVDYHACRPGHDRRYALDGTKLKELGWEPQVSFEDSLKSTVEWTLQNGFKARGRG